MTARSGTQLLYEMIAEAKGYADIIHMGRGDLDLDTPPHIVEAAKRAMVEHATAETPPEGILPLREAIAARVKRVNNINVDPATEVVVTNGGQEALFLMVLAALGPGEELLVPEPNYNTYSDAVRFARGVAAGVPTNVEVDFRVDPARMRQALTERTRAMLLASPNNPTAAVISPEDERQLVALAEEHDLLILADEIYDLFVYDDVVHLSPASLPGGRQRTLTLNALSKSFAMTGWRLGWITGPADWMAQVKQLKAAVSGATSIVSQHAAVAALTGPQDVVAEMHQTYIRRRQTIKGALDRLGVRYGASQGGQFLFADIGFTGMDSISLAQKILTEQHVLVYPGGAFAPGCDQYLRITFLRPEEDLRAGMERIGRVLNELRQNSPESIPATGEA
jgi:aspartate/methionine/tyrosine aminotransferase